MMYIAIGMHLSVARIISMSIFLLAILDGGAAGIVIDKSISNGTSSSTKSIFMITL
jgi:hypothetical protein